MGVSVAKKIEQRFVIVGGAGFIGSHFVDALLKETTTKRVTILDNFSSGREWHIGHHRDDVRFHLVRGDVSDPALSTKAIAGHDVVIHLASNPDVARAAIEPEIDFVQGTVLTNNVMEAMRRTGVSRLLYASGSGIYGDLGEIEATEDHGPLTPISTYGASKLAGEAMISSYCSMFGLSACIFRFGNVVGARQTHGVCFDFVRKLRNDPSRLQILGDGQQSKSYIHVSDVVAAVLHANRVAHKPFEAFNVATGDYVTVSEIAELAIEVLELTPHPTFEFAGGERGWSGDVPVVRLNTDRIKATGWRCAMNTRAALRRSLKEMASEERIHG